MPVGRERREHERDLLVLAEHDALDVGEQAVGDGQRAVGGHGLRNGIALARANCTQAAVDPGGLGARAAPQLIEVGVPTVLSNLLLGSPETFVAPKV